MEKATDQVIRDMFHIPEAEVLTIWSLPGWHGCPLASPERGISNCPLGFEYRGVPSEPQPWMKGLCEDDSWRDRWEDILRKCHQCLGKPRPSQDEKGRLVEMRKLLFQRRESK